ncbi:MAG: ATP-binding protein [Planctomycetota bacterium]
MPRKLRHLPAFALMILPLGALAWLGSAELGHQSERAERILASQAQTFVADAASLLERAISRRIAIFESVIAELDSLADASESGALGWALASRRLRSSDPSILDLCVLDGDARPLIPPPAFPTAATLPFRLRQFRELWFAEVLETLGDLEGAQEAYESALAQAVGVDGASRRPRILFALGALERRRDRFDEAENHYLRAGAEVRQLATERGESPDIRAIYLLAEAAVAEVSLERERDPQPAIDLAEEIADGIRDGCPEGVLVAVEQRLLRAAESRPDPYSRLLDLYERDLVRREGRTFAREYESSGLARTFERRLLRASGGYAQAVFAGSDGHSLMVLRELRGDEVRFQPDPGEGRARFLGFRMDLDRAVIESVGRLVAGAGTFALHVSDPDGQPLVPGPEVPDSERIASRTMTDGLSLAAIPLDRAAAISERRRSLRNRAALILLLSITAVVGATALWRSLRREAELAELKVSLVSRVTHDLKTPLALIRMYAETLERGRARTSEEATRFAGIVAREADGLSRAVDRILDFSRSQAGTLAYVKESSDLAEIASAAVDAWRPAAAARDIEVRLELDDEAPVALDPRAAISAIRDLLDNAGKYASDPTAVEQRFVSVEVRNRANRVILRIEDNGIGIPIDERQRVFESFYRASNAGEVRGTGLGLSLVRHFVDAHDGAIEIGGREGPGTVVEMTFPRNSADSELT